MEEYRGYKLNYYPKCDRYPTHDNRYQTFTLLNKYSLFQVFLYNFAENIQYFSI